MGQQPDGRPVFPDTTRPARRVVGAQLPSGTTIGGITVTLTEANRGVFPGYGLKLEGAIDKLVNLHGLGTDGHRIPASPINFQDAGYWTLVLPFSDGMEQVELITATQQTVFRYPFDFVADYSADTP